MLHQTFLFLGQLWQLFEVSQILEFLRYTFQDSIFFISTAAAYITAASLLTDFPPQEKKYNPAVSVSECLVFSCCL